MTGFVVQDHKWTFSGGNKIICVSKMSETLMDLEQHKGE